MLPLSCTMHFNIKNADIHCEITVAIATPITLNLKPITNIRFKITFTIPAAKR